MEGFLMLVKTNKQPRVGYASTTFAQVEGGFSLYLAPTSIRLDPQRGVLYTANEYAEGSTTVRATPQVKFAETLKAYEYLVWCIEQEAKGLLPKSFICDLSGTIPTKPFSLTWTVTQPSVSDDDDDDSDDSED